MKVLVLLVVGVLVCSQTGAQTVSKCQLVDKLRAAINSSHHATQKEEDLLVARIVCRVEHTSNFSTSIVTEQSQNYNRGHGRYDRSAHQESSRNEDHINVMHSEENDHRNSSSPNVTPGVQHDHGNSSSPQESDDDHHRRRRQSSQHQENEQGNRNMTHDDQNDHGNSSKPQESDDNQQHHSDSSHLHDNEQGDLNVTHGAQQDHGSSEHKHRSRRHAHHQNNEKNVTLYGILQLPECTCRNSMDTSANICGIDCSRLTDGNIDDDISCFFKIFPYNDENHSGGNHRDRPPHFGRHSREELEDEPCTLDCPELKMCKDVTADSIGDCPT